MKNKYFLIFILLLNTVFLSCQQESEKSYEVLIESTSTTPFNIFYFDLPEDATNTEYFLQSSQNEEIPVQVQNNGKALAVLTGLYAGKETSFSLRHGQVNDNGIELTQGDNSISFSSGGKEILAFKTKAELPRADIDSVYLRAGFIHPVHAPSGKIISDSYAHNHLHHHGIWAAWTKTEFEGRSPDFWNMAEKTGTVEFVSLDSTWTGPVNGGFKATIQYIDLTTAEKIKVLNETWEVNIFNIREKNEDFSIFDLKIEQENISSSPLILPEYHYGGLGFRGHESWNGEENTSFLTSEGKDRKDGHGTTARWCHIGGLVDGSPAGITIMNHPENFRAPQHMRIHPTEPFFCYTPSQGGDWAIEPGEFYQARYRFVVYDGEPDVQLIENMWKDYEQPVRVEVKQ
ncbi:hypothetical protein BH23BAC1_BH23BAC1_30900 [soil metagenome]